MGHQVLIIECETILGYGLLQQFTRWGWQVLELVGAGETGLAKARQTLPDLIVVNAVLAGELDGIQTAWQIQNHYQTPFLFIHHQQPDRQQRRALRQISTYTWLCKPFTIERLAQALQALLPTTGPLTNA